MPDKAVALVLKTARHNTTSSAGERIWTDQLCQHKGSKWKMITLMALIASMHSSLDNLHEEKVHADFAVAVHIERPTTSSDCSA